MKDGLIKLDSGRGKAFGFSSDLFGSGSYLWLDSGYVYISFIESYRRGNFRRLVARILDRGYGVKIPTALGRMLAIVEKNGYRQTDEDGAEVWVWDALKSKDNRP